MARRAALKTKRRRVRDDGWRLPDALWAKMERLLPPRPKHPLGCHNPRVPDRAAMDAIFFVLRTGCRWNALKETKICSSSSAHRRFQEWTRAGVFAAFWREGLLAYDALRGIDWTWLALDGAMGKAPLGGGETGRNPTDRGKRGVKRSLLTDGRGVPLGAAIDGANRNDHKLMRQTLAGRSGTLDRPASGRSTSASTRASTTTSRAPWPKSSASPCTSARVARRSGPSAVPGPRRGAGWWSARTHGCTAPAPSWSSGPRSPPTTSRCSTSRSPSSHGDTPYRDRLLAVHPACGAAWCR